MRILLRLLPLLTAACATVAPGAQTGAARFDWFEYRGEDATDAAPLDPNAYRNPILKGFYPDPSVTRAGEDFYLVTSTFAYFPGIPVFHSRDLVNWTQIGNAIHRPAQLDFGKLGLSRGVFAPDISEHEGIFYILNTCVDCGGNFLITARDPAGPWSDPIWLPDLEGGIDPSLFWDDDGSAWILNNGPPPGTPRYEGHRAIWIQRFDPAARRTMGPRTLLVNGGVDPASKPIWIEGPHILRKDGWYYLIAAEGGTAEGHSQVVLRSRGVTGPYAAFPGNPILTQRDLPPGRQAPITSAGHADFVQTPSGDWWATFLAVRPYAGDFYNTGRETFLLPVHWDESGWPRITGPGETISRTHARPQLPVQPRAGVPTSGAFAVRDDFARSSLPPYWMMMRNPRERWYRLSGGALELTPRPVRLSDFGNPSFIGRRQQHLHASASTVVRFAPAGDSDAAGLVALQNDQFWYFLAVGRDAGRLVVRLDRHDDQGLKRLASTALEVALRAPVYLKIDAHGDSYDFSFATRKGRWTVLRSGEDGTVLSTRRAGGFVGVVFGLHAYSAAP